MFFKKNKPIVLEAYAPVGDLIDYFPIKRTQEMRPIWFDKLPKSYNDDNVRNCSGLKDLLGEGFTIPSWGEFDITILPNGQADVKSPVSFYSMSPTSQHNVAVEAAGAWNGYTNLKFHNPWWFWCAEPIKWMLIQPTWHQSSPLDWCGIPGVVEFRYNNQANVNTLFRVGQQPYNVKIKTSDVMMHMIPITERPVTIELKVMTDEIYTEKFSGWAHSFKFGYQKIRNLMDKKNNANINTRE